MNYLAHIALAGDNPEHRVGGLLGDFVRGPLTGTYSPAIEAGIMAHRKLDSYVDQQPEMRAFLQRFDSPMRRYAGIVADVIYDHILAQEWHSYYPQTLDIFCQDFYRQLSQHRENLPPRALLFLQRAPTIGWLEGYRQADNLPMILSRIGQRLRRPVALEDALPVVYQHKTVITDEFHQLYPRLQTFVCSNLS
jgi:acyl carrier protein phosphodiesterase